MNLQQDSAVARGNEKPSITLPATSNSPSENQHRIDRLNNCSPNFEPFSREFPALTLVNLRYYNVSEARYYGHYRKQQFETSTKVLKLCMY
mmetsp:Transcript_11688/g.16038  ORF Transcript_11688/g.16038 Transcript_11688/m.16038 type:complete len:91 (-) Transcript_11688:182-454(-)